MVETNWRKQNNTAWMPNSFEINFNKEIMKIGVNQRHRCHKMLHKKCSQWICFVVAAYKLNSFGVNPPIILVTFVHMIE